MGVRRAGPASDEGVRERLPAARFDGRPPAFTASGNGHHRTACADGDIAKGQAPAGRTFHSRGPTKLGLVTTVADAVPDPHRVSRRARRAPHGSSQRARDGSAPLDRLRARRKTVSRWARRQESGGRPLRISSASATVCRPISRSKSTIAPARCGDRTSPSTRRAGSSGGAGSTGNTSVAARKRPLSIWRRNSGKSTTPARLISSTTDPGVISSNSRLPRNPWFSLVTAAKTAMTWLVRRTSSSEAAQPRSPP